MLTAIFWKKAWAWLKNYWYIPAVLVYTLVLWFVFRKKNDKIIEMFEISKENYKKEIDIINSAHSSEMAQKEEIIKDYQDALKKLQEEHNIKIENLSKEEEEEVQELIQKHKENPDVLVEEMKSLFGV
tara:strand:- start:15 stop:398 length:384 start_codon:yes stop_codon:yes gene_type:complete